MDSSTGGKDMYLDIASALRKQRIEQIETLSRQIADETNKEMVRRMTEQRQYLKNRLAESAA
jgi:hypothetical protein